MDLFNQLPIHSPLMSEVTRLLDSESAGDRHAAAKLLPLVYYELRKLAATKMAADNHGLRFFAVMTIPEAAQGPRRLGSDGGTVVGLRPHLAVCRPRRGII